jgi:hypothetical protein
LAVKKSAMYVMGQAVANLESVLADSRPARKSLADTNDQLQRLRAYVVPKMMDDDNAAMAIALARGQHDSAQLQSPELLQCSSKCDVPQTGSAPDIGRYYACIVSCAPELIPRIRSCNDLSWLSF